MLKSLIIAAATVAALAAPVGAQERATLPSDSLLVRENIYKELLGGLSVTDAQRKFAYQQIASALRAQDSLFPIRSQASWDRLLAIQARRDSAITAALNNEDTKREFIRRAEEAKPRSMIWK
jgi:hypothetical protein